MAYGLMSEANDLTLADIAALCDAFYLGGTKCGALFGEALVLTAPALDKDFRYALKQHGGMLAKGRLLGLQFLALLQGEDGRQPYFALAAKGGRPGRADRQRVRSQGCRMHMPPPPTSSSRFCPKAWADKLAEKYVYSPMGTTADGQAIVRFCTSWATRDEMWTPACGHRRAEI